MATNTQSNSQDMLLFGKSFITAHVCIYLFLQR